MRNVPEENTLSADDAEGLRLLQAYQNTMHSFRDGRHGEDLHAVELSADAFLAYACAQAAQMPSQDLLWKQEAHEHEAAGRWPEAEAAYLRCLALAQTQNETMMEYKAHSDLSGLYRFLARPDQATRSAEAAAHAARRSGSETLLTMALEGVARCYLDAGNVNDALCTVEEILRLLEQDDADGLNGLNELSEARALTLRARCFVERKETADAERDLADALPLLTPLSGAVLLAGVQSGLANWWAVSAQVAAQKGNVRGAGDAWQKSVGYARVVSQAGHLDGPFKFAGLARSLQKQADFLLEIGDTTGTADKALHEARAIRAAIQQPDGGI